MIFNLLKSIWCKQPATCAKSVVVNVPDIKQPDFSKLVKNCTSKNGKQDCQYSVYVKDDEGTKIHLILTQREVDNAAARSKKLVVKA